MKYAILLLFMFTQATAQQLPDYVVYRVNGDVTVQKALAKPEKIKLNQFIYAPETITLKQGAQLTLINKEGASFVLTTPKSYPVALLGKQQMYATDNLTKRYLHLLYRELLEPNYDYKKFQKTNTGGGAWGGINRSGECDNLIFPVKSMTTAEMELPFKWRKTSAVNRYSLKIYDAELKELASIPVKDTSVLVDLTSYTAGKTGKYYWLINGEEGECEEEIPYAFEVISRNEEARILSTLQSADSSLLGQLALANELEKRNLILTAKQHLDSLSEKHNDPVLVKTLTWFLLKYQLDEEAEKTWKKRNY